MCTSIQKGEMKWWKRYASMTQKFKEKIFNFWKKKYVTVVMLLVYPVESFVKVIIKLLNPKQARS